METSRDCSVINECLCRFRSCFLKINAESNQASDQKIRFGHSPPIQNWWVALGSKVKMIHGHCFYKAEYVKNRHKRFQQFIDNKVYLIIYSLFKKILNIIRLRN